MQKDSRENSRKLLTALCVLTYFVSYLTRINYGAVLLEIVRTEGYTKTAVSMAVTGAFVTYGAGQLISGFLGDHVKPQLLIFIGLLTTAALNVAVPLVVRPDIVLVLWSINGFAQALMWPPLVRIMSAYMSNEQYKKSCVKVSWGASVATIVIYLLAPVCIRFLGWKSLFFLCAAIAGVYAFCWRSGMKKVQKHLEPIEERTGGIHAEESKHADRNLHKNGDMQESRDVHTSRDMHTNEDGHANRDLHTAKKRKNSAGLHVSSGLVVTIGLIMLGIVMQGALRDGITTWMPTYISETFQLGSQASILTGVALPVFSIVCIQLASVVNRKLIRNEMLCAAALFLPGCIGAVVLAFCPDSDAVLSVLLSTVITGSMHGVNLILTSMIPPYFKKYGNVAFISGLLNSCTYLGSALSSYGIAYAAQVKGWRFVTILWAAVATAGTLLCLCDAGRWKQVRK